LEHDGLNVFIDKIDHKPITNIGILLDTVHVGLMFSLGSATRHPKPSQRRDHKETHNVHKVHQSKSTDNDQPEPQCYVDHLIEGIQWQYTKTIYLFKRVFDTVLVKGALNDLGKD
jgi:hypothetical protein